MPTRILSTLRFLERLVLLLLVLPSLASAQGLLFFSATNSNLTIPGVPFQAKVVGRYMKIQRDGTKSMAGLMGTIARDSKGRVRVEQQQPDQPTVDEVLDPIAAMQFVWTGGSKVVIQSANLGRPPWHVTLPANTIDAVRESVALQQKPDTVTQEDLGTKAIGGLTTTGTRITIQQPNGLLIHEVWVADLLKVAVIDTFTEPQGEPQTIELQDIHQGEPDGAIFDLPQGYMVQGPGGPGAVLGGVQGLTMPRPPDAPPEPRIKVSPQVAAAKLVSQTKPVAPDLAQRAHITGDVVLHVIIGQDGTIESLQVVSGHPLLVQAAVDAVKQWRYMPTMLNGMPVAVDTTITIPFDPNGTP